jgi:hypothetical protein
MKPGTYWFSAKLSDPRPVRLDLAAGQYYFMRKEHGELVIKDFQSNYEFIEARRSYAYDRDLSKLPDTEMRELTAAPSRKYK